MRQETKSARFMNIPPRIGMIVLILILLSLACNMPVASVSAPDQTAVINTSVAKTIAAQGGVVLEDSSDQESEPPPPTEEGAPEISLTPSLTPTVTDTPEPDVAMVYASANTNCRTGQGTVFKWLMTLMEGESAEAVGIDTSGDYWYIRMPDQPTNFCWLWGQYATPSGPYQSLPVYTPMPTPTPGFEFNVTYKEMYQCGFWYGLQFQIINTGALPLESWKSTGTDNSGGLSNSPNKQDSFFDGTSCSIKSEQQDLTTGEGSYMNVVFAGDPDGHDLTVKFKVCTKDGLGGKCLTKTINITP